MKIVDSEFLNKAKKTVADMVTSISTILTETAKRAIRKTQEAFKKAERDKQQYLAQQAQLAQQVWVDTYTQETAPALAEIFAEALNATLRITISPLNVFGSFINCDETNTFVWNVECAVGDAYDTEKVDVYIFMRHINAVFRNIHRNAVKEFDAFFQNAWNKHKATYDGQLIRYDYFRRNRLKLWQIKVVGIKPSMGVISMTVHLVEMPPVSYFASRI